MYFKSFPYTFYSLDDTSTVQVVTNITTRVTLSEEVKTNLSLFDEYDIRDGETPELVANKFYGNSELHWLVLHYNDIIDPRFDWPMDTNNLNRYVAGKYTDTNATHHFEDASGNYTNGNAYILSSNAFANFNVNDAITNNTNNGVAYITQKNSSSNVRITITTGGFKTGDQILKSSNTTNRANITSTVILSGTPVTNFAFEDELNESKRRIKILKSSYIDAVVNDFKKKLGE
jgi:hypothetical protein